MLQQFFKSFVLVCSNALKYLLTALIYIELTTENNVYGRGLTHEATWWANYFRNSGNTSDIVLKILNYVEKNSKL